MARGKENTVYIYRCSPITYIMYIKTYRPNGVNIAMRQCPRQCPVVLRVYNRIRGKQNVYVSGGR